jgi:hypothetical protein
MPVDHPQVRRMTCRTLVLPLIVMSLTSACSSWPAPSEPPPQELEEKTAKESAAPPPPVVVRDLELERKLALSELLLLEKDVQLGELQARLDAARQEVVRAMAKQQSLASRAEAASAMAEAEIALQSLPAAAGARGVPEVSRLIGLSAAEFDQQNYAGALYLASQAKSAAFAARGQLASGNRGPLRAGERPFATPLKLRTATGANVRDGPGSTFKVIFTLPAGALLTGFSHAEQWVRIADESGRDGWIYQGLIGRRP